MVKKLGNYQIPFDAKTGNLMDYPSHWIDKVWRDNEVFEDTLTYDVYSRGMSSVGFAFKRSNGITVNVFPKDITSFFPFFEKGKVTGKFCYVKRGQNYGVTIFEG